jgi:hypothetical protein
VIIDSDTDNDIETPVCKKHTADCEKGLPGNMDSMCNAIKLALENLASLGIPNRVHADVYRAAVRITEGRILAHIRDMSSAIINRSGASLCVYKFGITADPVGRKEFYVADNYTVYEILHVSNVLDAVSWGEAYLIHEFSHHSNIGSCRNVRLGGDGALALKTNHRDQLFYLYIAAARADSGRAIG